MKAIKRMGLTGILSGVVMLNFFETEVFAKNLVVRGSDSTIKVVKALASA